MRDNFWVGFVTGWVVFGVLVTATLIATDGHPRSMFEAEAVSAGAGGYSVNPKTGEVTFRWRTTDGKPVTD